MGKDAIQLIYDAGKAGFSCGIRNSGCNTHYYLSEQYVAWNIGFQDGKKNRVGRQRRKDDIIENVIEIEEV